MGVISAEAFEHIKRIYGRLDDYYTPSEATAWLHAKHPQIEDGRTPHQCIEDGDEKVVDAILDRLDGGVYL